MSDDRTHLYGTPGAEEMHFDPEEALVAETNDLVTIEEWTVRPPREHLPPAAHLLEWLSEAVWWESAVDVTKEPEVIAAAEALLDAFAAKITYRMADKHIANLRYRWDGDEDTGEYVLVSREVTDAAD